MKLLASWVLGISLVSLAAVDAATYEEQILELSPAELAGNQAIQVQLKAASYNLEEVQ